MTTRIMSMYYLFMLLLLKLFVGICVGIAGLTCVDGVPSCCDDCFLSLVSMSTMVLICSSSYVGVVV